MPRWSSTSITEQPVRRYSGAGPAVLRGHASLVHQACPRVRDEVELLQRRGRLRLQHGVQAGAPDASLADVVLGDALQRDLQHDPERPDGASGRPKLLARVDRAHPRLPFCAVAGDAHGLDVVAWEQLPLSPMEGRVRSAMRHDPPLRKMHGEKMPIEEVHQRYAVLRGRDGRELMPRWSSTSITSSPPYAR